MTTITLEVPDELAARLQPLRDRLPELLTQVLDSWPVEKTLKVTGSAVTYPVFQEIISFLASGPTPEQIILHQASPTMQERLGELLDKNREAELTEAESAELDAFELVNDVMILLKARARLAQSRPR
jgi:hypothetical protein